MDQRYAAWRAEIDAYFQDRFADSSTRIVERSPSGLYELEVTEYTTGPDTWRYSRGIVRSVADQAVIADVRRNYVHFWHAWVEHANGSEYLLCGEDYQGQTVVNLTKRTVHYDFPEEGTPYEERRMPNRRSSTPIGRKSRLAAKYDA